MHSIVTIPCYTEKGSDLGRIRYENGNSIVFCLNKSQKYYGEGDLFFGRNLYAFLLGLLCSKETFFSAIRWRLQEPVLECEVNFWLGRTDVLYFFVKILLAEESGTGTFWVLCVCFFFSLPLVD